MPEMRWHWQLSNWHGSNNESCDLGGNLANLATWGGKPDKLHLGSSFHPPWYLRNHNFDITLSDDD